MAAPHNVELEAAKFLHKLIQESKDEPTKLATKLLVILQHMRSSGKENSMPYQVISRAMETVINQHGLDIEALKSSRPPVTGGTHMGDSSSTQFVGSSQTAAITKDSKTGMAENEVANSHASSRPPVGPSGAGHDIYQGSVSHLSTKSLDHESPSSFETRSANSQSQERHDTAKWEKANQNDSKKASSKRKRADLSSITESRTDNPQQLDTCNLNARKGKLVNKVEPHGSLSVKGSEHSQFNMVQGSVQMEHIPSLPSSMRSTNITNSMSRAANSKYPEEIEVSSAHSALGLQQGGSRLSTHDILSSRGLWNQNRIGFSLEKPQVSRFPSNAGSDNLTAEILMQQSTAPLESGVSGKLHGAALSASGSYPPVEPGILSPMHFSTASYDNHGLVTKMNKESSREAFSASPSVELSAGKAAVDSEYWKHGFMKGAVTGTSERTGEGQLCSANRGELGSSSLSTRKALEHDGGTSNVLANANKIVQSGIPGNITEMNMLRGAAPRDTGKSAISEALAVSNMPFKEQHLKQLRAQCLVFLAFRNGLMPKKLHLEIALGNFLPKEDGPHKELIDHKGKELSMHDPSNILEDTMLFGRNVRETEIVPQAPSSTGILPGANLLKESEDPNMMGSQPDYLRTRGLAVSNHKDDLETGQQAGIANQASFVGGISKQMKPEMISWSGIGSHNEVAKGLVPGYMVSYKSVPERKDSAPSESQVLADCNIQGSRHPDSHLPSFPSSEDWNPISGMASENRMVMPVKDANDLMKNVSEDDQRIPEIQRRCFPDGCKTVLVDNMQKNGGPMVVEAEQEEQDIFLCTDSPPPPKYTTSEKWIMEQQKRKLLIEQSWALKQRKTEQRIAVSSDKLKETVSSSEDISAKTKSVIKLKKLQLLELQRRLRSDILNDFFKPIATEMDRLKSIKKHRIGRRSKQLERFEQKMKEERQKRIRERQKEFFSEVEVHKERLDDVFKLKRERWKGFNKYVREFHKRKERIHREKIDRIQREKINLLKINDVEGYLRMVQDAKSDRVKQLLKETEKYLSKLGSKLQAAKATERCFETDIDENRAASVVEYNEIFVENEDEADQAKHYLESNEKYYLMAHSIKESITEQPSSLVGGKLREYQMNGLRWLVSLYNNHLNGILADEMGLGKTVQVIALMCYLMETKNDRGPFLVVVPSSVLPGWETEINFWAPGVNKIVYSGPPEERRRLFKERIVQQKFNVLLTTYEYLMNKHDRPKLSKVHWHYIIIDEGHRIKNASCKLNADLKHYHSSHRLLLTGTPLQNNLEELWALLNFLLPNIFNSSEDFSQWFNKPFESNGDNSPDEALLSEEENLLIINRLHQVLRPFVLRRLKHKVENQLPEKIERLVRCEASAYQKLLMKRVEDNLGAIGTSKARSVHNSVMELRNICNHPYLSQLHVEEVHDLVPKHYLPTIVRLCGKLEMLDRLLPKLKATGHRVLFFSTMTRLLDVMEDYLCWKQYRYLRLDGHTSGSDRGALIDGFNQPGSPFFIFLLSIRAGGVGVNLQAADTVIIFDTDWNPQVDLQAQARAHRIGQKKDVLVLRLETVQTVEEQVRAAAEHKLGVANQSITAGFFDNNTSAEDRREYLESLLRESKKEEAAPVLDDDSLNDLIARSESEIDIFESIDRQRREEEMATWKKLVLGQGKDGSEPTPPLPSRLLTDDDLKPFYKVMNISAVSNARVAPNVGAKRKSESLGGLDTQHYGRGKRAREVRSYEEQWTEEEFEKMCQADSPDSPKLKEEVTENNSPLVVSGSITVAAKTEPPAPPTVSSQPPAPPIVSPQSPAPPIVSPQPPAPPTVSPQPPAPHTVAQQPSIEPPMQQSKEVTPPSRRGRGRPKRATAEISPCAVVHPAPSGASKSDMASQRGAVSSFPVAPGSDSLSSSATVKSVTGTIHQFGVWIAPSSDSTPPLPSVSPGAQSTPTPSPSVTMQVKGRKTRGGAEVPRGRGKKQSLLPPAVPVPPAPSGTGKTYTIVQRETVSSFPTASWLDSVSGSAMVKGVSNEPGPVSTAVPVLASSSESGKLDLGSGVRPDSSNSMVPGPDSFPATSVTGISGTVHHFEVGIVPSSQPNHPFTSDDLGSQSIPPSLSVAKQSKGRGRKPQSGVAAPRRRGKTQGPTAPVAADCLAGQDAKSNEQAESEVQVSSVRKSISTRRKRGNEAMELTNAVQVQASEVQTSDGLASPDAKPTGQSDYMAQNRQQKGLSTTHDSAATSSDKIDSQTEKIHAKAIEMKGPILEEAVVSESEVAETECLSEERKFSTSETAAAGVDPEIQNTDKDVSAEKHKINDPILQEDVISKSEVCELQTKLDAGSFGNVKDSSNLAEENPIVKTNLGGTSTVPLNTEPLDDVPSEKPPAPDASVSETATSILHHKMDCEDRSGKEDVEEQEMKGPGLEDDVVSEPGETKTLEAILQEAVISKSEACEPEPKINSDSLENVADQRDVVEENSIAATNVEFSLAVPLSGNPSDDVPCEKSPAPDASILDTTGSVIDLKMDSKDQSRKEDAKEDEMHGPVLVDAVVSEPGETRSLEEKKFSTLSTLETAAPVVASDSEIEKAEMVVDAEPQKMDDPISQDAVVSKPEAYEPETKFNAGFFENVADQRDLVKGKSTVGTNGEVTSAVPLCGDLLDDVICEKPVAHDAFVLETAASVMDLTMDSEDQPGKEDVKEEEMQGPVLDDVVVSEPGEMKSLEEKKFSTLSTFETAVPVVHPDSEIEKTELEVGAEAQESSDRILQGAVVSKPEACEPETKINASSFGNVAEQRELVIEHSTVGTNAEVTSAVPLSGDPSDDVPCEKPPPLEALILETAASVLDVTVDCEDQSGKEAAKEQEMQDPVLGNVVVLEGRETKSSEVKKFSTLSTLETAGRETKSSEVKKFSTLSTLATAVPAFDPDSEIEKIEMEVNAEAHESSDPTLQGTVVSKPVACEPETKINAGFSENLADQRDLVIENSTHGTNVEVTSAVPLSGDPSDDVPCEKPPAPDASVLETAASVLDVSVDCEDHSGKEGAKEQEMRGPVLDDVVFSAPRETMPTMETAVPVVDPDSENEKTQMEIDPEARESSDPFLQEAFVLRPGACEPETKMNASSFENVADQRDLVKENSTAGTNAADDVPFEKLPAPDASVLDLTITCEDRCGEEEREMRGPVLDVVVSESWGAKNLEEKRISTLSTLETAATPVFYPEIVKTEMEVDAEAQESNDSILQEAVVSKPEACEPESKINSGSFENVPDQRDLVKENLISGTNVEVTSAVPLSGNPSDDVPCEKPPAPDASVLETTASVMVLPMDGEDQSGKDDAKEQEMPGLVLEDVVVSVPEETKVLEEKKFPTLSTLETAAPIVDPEIEKPEKKVDVEAQENNDLILQEAVVSKPEACEPETSINASSVENMADPGVLMKGNLISGIHGEVTSSFPLDTDPSDDVTCGKTLATDVTTLDLTMDKGEDHGKEDAEEQKLKGPLSDEAVVPDLRVAEILSSEERDFSTLSTLETADPGVDPEIGKTEKEVNAESEESNDPILPEAIVSKPEGCESETKLLAE